MKDLAKEIETFDLPLKDEESIPFAGTGTFAIEQFRKLKTHIFRITPNPPRCILITSTVPQEGKTMVTMNLAMSIAQELHKKVIVIDADLRRPSVYPVKFNNKKGLSDYLANETPIADVLKSFDSEKFVVIPAGSPSSEPRGAYKFKKNEGIDRNYAGTRRGYPYFNRFSPNPLDIRTIDPVRVGGWNRLRDKGRSGDKRVD